SSFRRASRTRVPFRRLPTRRDPAAGSHMTTADSTVEAPAPAPGSTRILGIDPGSVRTGFGIVDADSTGRCTHVHNGALLVGGAEDFPMRLKAIFDGLGELL